MIRCWLFNLNDLGKSFIVDYKLKLKTMLKIIQRRGFVTAIGAPIEAIVREWSSCAASIIPEECVLKREERDGDSHHITLSIDALSLDKAQFLLESVPIGTGIGTLHQGESVCYFIVVVWPGYSNLFPDQPLDLHITLGFFPKDIHCSEKSTLIRCQNVHVEYMLKTFLSSSCSYREKLSVTDAIIFHANEDHPKLVAELYLMRAKWHVTEGDDLLKAVSETEEANHIKPTPRGMLLLGDTLVKLNSLTEAIESYHKGLSLCKQPSSVRSNLLKRLEHHFEAPETQAKFPRTRHAFDLGGATRDDLLLPRSQWVLYCHENVTIEEKVDGANLGIYFDKDWTLLMKNRSKFICSESGLEWTGLDEWISSKRVILANILGQRYVLYGEWMFAKHSIHYTQLPDLFLAFDIYDKIAQKFVSVSVRNHLLRDSGIHIVRSLPLVHLAEKSFESVLTDLLSEHKSQYYDGLLEGLVLRYDESPGTKDDISYLNNRCKLVRSEFRQEITDHWTKAILIKNILAVPAMVKSAKYPSTPHFPFSPCINDDDTMSSSTESQFIGKRAVVTEKLDGSNCCLKHGLVFGRTHSHPATHWSFNQIKTLNMGILPVLSTLEVEFGGELELYGENMSAIHSIEYHMLYSAFYLFAVKVSGEWLSWDEVVRVAAIVGIPTAPIVFDGTFQNMAQLESCLKIQAELSSRVSLEEAPEGFVVRLAGRYVDMGVSVAKYVRSNHIQTTADWKRTCLKASINTSLNSPTRDPVTSENGFTLYVDLDGVLADFDTGCFEVTGRNPDSIAVSQMWRCFEATQDFFANLEWMPGAEEMWNEITKHIQPTILSGVPTRGGSRWADRQKQSWTRKKLGDHVPLITCASREKQIYSGPCRILIDDRARIGRAWEANGGIFIHHKSPGTTLRELRKLLQNQTEESGVVEKRPKKSSKRRSAKVSLVILVGLPGSGKSTFAKKLIDKVMGYTRVSQDELRSKSKCEELVGKLCKKHHVILDRCNVDDKERKYWMNIGMTCNVMAVYFDKEAPACVASVIQRENHPTIHTTDEIAATKIVKSFSKRLIEPNISEGFTKVITISNYSDVEEAIHSGVFG